MIDILIWLAIALAAVFVVSSVLGLIWFTIIAIQFVRNMPDKEDFK